MMEHLRWLRCVVASTVALLFLSATAHAQIMPLKGRLEYSAAADKWPTLEIKAANGSPAYVLSLELSQYEYRPRDTNGKPVGIELVMRRPHAKQDSPNLVEPRIWHGVQPFLFDGWDFVDGPQDHIYGSVRTIDITRRKLKVTVTVADVAVQPAKNPELQGAYDFDKLVLDVEVENTK
ncbi:MAG: hypothetical protein EPO08_00925 [Rhodospirillaceae bacterium]|nr:MAG: hypothetical protein EPO08_00925 [Rhodospirillaceae bacterium]